MKGHTPPMRSLLGGLSSWRSVWSSGVYKGAQSLCEVVPACWPQPGLPSASNQSLHNQQEDLALRRLPYNLQWGQLSLWLKGFYCWKPKGCIWKPTIQCGMLLLSLVLWAKQTVEWLLCVCIFLSQRDKLLHWPPCTYSASAFSIPIF